MHSPRFFFLFVLHLLTVVVHAETEAELAARAAALHARIFTIDTHIDTPTLSLRRPGWDISQRHEWTTDFSQCDFPRMVEGGLKAGVFAVYVDQGPRTPAGYAAVRDNALRTFFRVHAVAERFPKDCGLALTADDGPRLMAVGKRALYLSIENGYAIGKDLTLIKTYHDLGARFFGFVHNLNNDLGDSAQPGVRQISSETEMALVFMVGITRVLGITMNPPDKRHLLQQIAAITAMERGKLSSYSPNGGPAASGSYTKLQRWESGKNHTRHIPTEEVPAVQAALAGYAHYQQLTAQYADLVIAETRQSLAEEKKRRRRPFASRKKRKSNN